MGPYFLRGYYMTTEELEANALGEASHQWSLPRAASYSVMV